MSDRHARHRRSPADRRRRPVDGYRVADADRFDRLVDDAVGGLPDELLRYLDEVEMAVAEVPPGGADEREVVLGRLRRLPANASSRGPGAATARLTVYRRPLEARAHNRADLLELIQLVVVQELADHFGIGDDRLDELGWG
ncbi:metallopeptidase family protein [Egicoccus sp. AB-alg6-2]|uniref:metallopeptidase family protein n=1 Tax=Egicoccus sp. AB-alg6-2 TaxID=3242692 RepID=UPI00359DEA3A